MNEEIEEQLPGGNVNKAVRVGATVRKPSGPWTPAVHALLRHLELAGFDAAPRALGVDDQGREILTYIEGQPASRPWFPLLRSDEGLGQFAQLIRGYHDAIRDFVPPPDAVWRIGKRPLLEGEIVCHGDLGPWNSIWRDDSPVGLIDWDFAYPGPVWDDVAYAAWQIIPLRPDEACWAAGFTEIPDRRHRLQAFSEAYGVPEYIDLVTHALRVQAEDHERTTRLGARGVQPWTSFLERGLAEESLEESEWLTSHRSLFV